jgi:hypothetical protein
MIKSERIFQNKQEMLSNSERLFLSLQKQYRSIADEIHMQNEKGKSAE